WAVEPRSAPGPDQERRAGRRVGDRLARQLDGHRGDRDRALADRRLAADALAHLERVAEEPVEQRPDRVLLLGELERRAHLALDLALADDHRVEARGHPEDVRRGAVVAQRVAGALELRK